MVTNPASRKDILIKQEDVLSASAKIISAEIVLQRMNVSSVRVNTISAFAYPMATVVPTFQEQHPIKNVLRSNRGTMVPQAVMKVATTLVQIPQEPHPHRNRSRTVQDRTSQPYTSVPLLQSSFKQPMH